MPGLEGIAPLRFAGRKRSIQAGYPMIGYQRLANMLPGIRLGLGPPVFRRWRMISYHCRRLGRRLGDRIRSLFGFGFCFRLGLGPGNWSSLGDGRLVRVLPGQSSCRSGYNFGLGLKHLLLRRGSGFRFWHHPDKADLRRVGQKVTGGALPRGQAGNQEQHGKIDNAGKDQSQRPCRPARYRLLRNRGDQEDPGL